MRRSAPLLIAVTVALSSVAPAGAPRTILHDPIPTHPLAIDLPIIRPGGARSGFLTSLTELVNKTLTVQNGDKLSTIRSIPYVHGDQLYELRLLESTPLARFEQDGRTFEGVIRGRFETARAGSRSGTRFELVYGASGPLAGVPILVSYQPKWWLQVDLVLQNENPPR